MRFASVNFFYFRTSPFEMTFPTGSTLGGPRCVRRRRTVRGNFPRNRFCVIIVFTPVSSYSDVEKGSTSGRYSRWLLIHLYLYLTKNWLAWRVICRALSKSDSRIVFAFRQVQGTMQDSIYCDGKHESPRRVRIISGRQHRKLSPAIRSLTRGTKLLGKYSNAARAEFYYCQLCPNKC